MATITVNIQAAQTVSTLDAATIAAVIAWVKTNITDKVPNGTTVSVSYQITP